MEERPAVEKPSQQKKERSRKVGRDRERRERSALGNQASWHLRETHSSEEKEEENWRR